MAFAAVTVIVLSIVSVGSGIVAVSAHWVLLLVVVSPYVTLLVMGFLAVLWALAEEARERWRGTKKPLRPANRPSGLWDREIDG